MNGSTTPLKHVRVFVSYAKQDELIADYLQNFLNRAGYQASTFTANVAPGDRWISAISQSLEGADVIVILLSKASLASPWVTYEISASIVSAETGLGKRVIPVALEKGISPSGILAQYQWITTSGDPQEVAEQVARALEAPHELDKAQERENALRSLGKAQQALALDELIWSQARSDRNASLARWLLLSTVFITFVTLALTAAGLFVSAHNRSDPVVGAIVAAAASLIAVPLAYVSGRFRSGVPDDRSDR